MSQTAYSVEAAQAFPGLLADPNANAFIRSLANEDAALAVFGLGYALGTDGATQFAAFSGAGTFAGVLVHRHNTQARELSGTVGIEQDEMGDLLTSGRVWVLTDEAVTAGGAAFVRHTTSDIGLFRSDVDGGDAQAVNGMYLTSTSGSGLVLLQVNEPVVV